MKASDLRKNQVITVNLQSLRIIVFFRGLKTKIAFNIAILFFVAMLLINIITVMTAQRDIIRKEVSKGQFILSTVKADLLNSLKLETVLGNIFQGAGLSIANRSRCLQCIGFG
jgi:hypothetical protein